MPKKSIIIPVLILGAALAILLTIKGCWTTWENGGSEQRTDDAFVRADVTPLSTRISGTVRKIDVADFANVQAGQTLIELEDADYEALLNEAKAALAAAEAELEDNQATKRTQDAKIEGVKAMVRQAEAGLSAAKAGVASIQADVTRASAERKREETLFATKAATRQQLEAVTADSDRLSGMLLARQSDVTHAEAALSGADAQLEAEMRQRAALDTSDEVYRAQIAAKRAAIVIAGVNLGYTKILAPTSGVVGERHVQVGQLVPAGMQVIDLVNGNNWIQANFKETQLGRIRPGDTADISIDSFPSVTLHGKVSEVAPASGSQFALLPPDNATGNFTKVVQRVPVKILLNKDQSLGSRLRPGFSAIVTVHTSGQEQSGR